MTCVHRKSKEQQREKNYTELLERHEYKEGIIFHGCLYVREQKKKAPNNYRVIKISFCMRKLIIIIRLTSSFLVVGHAMITFFHSRLLSFYFYEDVTRSTFNESISIVLIMYFVRAFRQGCRHRVFESKEKQTTVSIRFTVTARPVSIINFNNQEIGI